MLVFSLNPEKLHSVFSQVGAFVSECTVQFSENRMKVSAVDTAKIGLVNMTVEDSFFETFESDGVSFGLPLDRFLNVIELCIGVGEVVYLRFDESENTLEIQCGGLLYSLSLVESKSVNSVPEVPEMDLACSATFEAKELTDAVSAGSMFSDFVTFKSDNERVSVSGGGENNAMLSKKGSNLVQFDRGVANSTFKSTYFSSILKEVNNDEEITVSFDVDCPAFIEFSPTTNSESNIKYVLAPRIKATD